MNKQAPAMRACEFSFLLSGVKSLHVRWVELRCPAIAPTIKKHSYLPSSVRIERRQKDKKERNRTNVPSCSSIRSFRFYSHLLQHIFSFETPNSIAPSISHTTGAWGRSPTTPAILPGSPRAPARARWGARAGSGRPRPWLPWRAGAAPPGTWQPSCDLWCGGG